MAGGNGLWQRLPTLSKFGLVFGIVNIGFLLVSLGLTAWSISGYTFFINFFEQRSSSSTSFPTSIFTDSDITSTGTSSGFSVTDTTSSRTTRSYSTFTSTYTSTRTSYTTDPASYTSTDFVTFSLLGTPYRTATYYYGGERSAYTTFTMTGERLARTQLRKRRDLSYDETSAAAAAKPSPSVRSPTARGPVQVQAAYPTSAPAPPKPVAEAPRSPLLSDNLQVQLALPRTMRLLRRQSLSSSSTIEDFIRAARMLLALNSVILAAVVIQLLLCVSYIVVLSVGHKSHRTDHRLLRWSTKCIYMAIIVTSLLIFVFAITSVAYGTETLGQTSNYVALFIIFWLLCAILGFILAINAYKLSRHSFHHLNASRDSTIEPLETEQQENGPFIFAFNRDQQQADREAHQASPAPAPAPVAAPVAAQSAPSAAAAAAGPVQASAEATSAATQSQAHLTSAPSAPASSALQSQLSASASQTGSARQYNLQEYSPHTHTHDHCQGELLPDGRRSKDVPAPPPYSDSEARCSHCADAQ